MNTVDNRIFKVSILYVIGLLVFIKLVQAGATMPLVYLYPTMPIIVKVILSIVILILSYVLAIYLFYTVKGYRFKMHAVVGLKKSLVFGLAMTLAVFAVSTLVPLVNLLPQNEDVTEAFQTLSQVPLLAIFMILVVAPVFEELIFRGIILEGLANRYNNGVAIVISSLLFGAFHFNIQQGITATLIGCVAGWLYILTGSLRYTIWFHALYNFSVMFAGVVFFKAVSENRILALPAGLSLIALCAMVVYLFKNRSSIKAKFKVDKDKEILWDDL